MSSSVNLADQGLYYKVNHPEFRKDMAYKALAIISFSETAWDQIVFINDRGMTYSVKNSRCFCLNGQKTTTKKDKQVETDRETLCCSQHGFITSATNCYIARTYVADRKWLPTTRVNKRAGSSDVELEFTVECWSSYPIWVQIEREFVDLPHPKPVGKNPDNENYDI